MLHVERKSKMILLPRVVRIGRRGGKVLQDCDIYIGRAVQRGGWNLEASKWANPFKIKPGLPVESCSTVCL